MAFLHVTGTSHRNEHAIEAVQEDKESNLQLQMSHGSNANSFGCRK